MELLNSSAKTIKLNKLISLILHFFTRSHQLFVKVNNNEFKANVNYKKGNERFTDADWVLQKMIENYFAKFYPAICLIGEEDTSDDLIKESEFFSVEEEINLNFDIVKESDLPENIREVKTDELAIYIDPIDATEQFIKRNFPPVTSLVGISRNEKPFVGFVYFPYYEGKENNSLVFMNIPTKGIFCYNTLTGETTSVNFAQNEEDKWVFISSSSRTNNKMISLYESFENSSIRQVPGLGMKSVECMLYDNVFLASGKNLGLWDVCAGHCLCKEIGGGLYYLDGTELTYPKETTTRNLNGICFMTANSKRVQKFLETYRKSNISFEE